MSDQRSYAANVDFKWVRYPDCHGNRWDYHYDKVDGTPKVIYPRSPHRTK